MNIFSNFKRPSVYLSAALAAALAGPVVGHAEEGAGQTPPDTKHTRGEQREYDKQLKTEQDRNSNRDRVNSGRALSDAERKEQEKQQKQREFAELKEQRLANLASVKETFIKAEACWKEKQYAEAGALYKSVELANVSGSESMVETARNRGIELEDLAKSALVEADTADTQMDYVKEVELLSCILKTFKYTQIKDTAFRKLTYLKSRPDVTAYVDIAQAEALEGEGKLSEAVKIYREIATNSRFENTVPALKAKRRIEDLERDETTRTKLQAELSAKADKEAPQLLATARNFASNNMPQKAIEKLELIIEKYPDSAYAKQAETEIKKLK